MPLDCTQGFFMIQTVYFWWGRVQYEYLLHENYQLRGQKKNTKSWEQPVNCLGYFVAECSVSGEGGCATMLLPLAYLLPQEKTLSQFKVSTLNSDI